MTKIVPNNMIWISVIIIIALQCIPTGKQQSHLFKDWSDKLIKLTVLDKNWFTTTNSKCTDVSDFIYGNCVFINHMENDSNLSKQFVGLSPLHIFCYTLVRRLLEVICLYLARWMPIVCVFLFFCTSCTAWGVFFWKQNSILRKKKRDSPYFAKCLIAAVIMFLLSSLAILVIIVPMFAELIFGGVVKKELETFQEDSDQFLFEKVLEGKKPCSTFFDLYYFSCLRKTIFDLEASGLRKSVPVTLSMSEKFCLQVQMTLINGIAIVAFCIIYLIPVLLCYVLFRFCKKKFSLILNKDQSRGIVMKQNIWQYVRPLEKSSGASEYCDKKILEPGVKTPWKELNFSTSLEDNLEYSINKKSDVKDVPKTPPKIYYEPMRDGSDGEADCHATSNSKADAIETQKDVNSKVKSNRTIAGKPEENCELESPKRLPKKEAKDVKEDFRYSPREKRRNYVIEKPFPRRSRYTEYDPIKKYSSSSKRERLPRTEDGTHSPPYADAATYVCFESDLDSEESDYFYSN